MRLLRARVAHAREKPAKNSFEYEVFYVETPVSKSTPAHPALFSFDRFNIFSIRTRDHGARDSSAWRDWFSHECEVRGIRLLENDDVSLISHPRILGYAFNPISFWLLRRGGALIAVLCEVNNTFGDNHNYLLAHDDLRPISREDRFRAEKKLYVSPFNKVEGYYAFSFGSSGDAFSASISYFVGEERVVATYMGGSYSALTDLSVLRSIFAYPLMTVMIIYRIHYQALKLRLKGVTPTISTMPEPINGGTTQGSSLSDE